MTGPILKHTAKALADRAEAVRQANANISLEGFVVDPKVAELNQRFTSGEISLNEKLLLIKSLYIER